MPTIDVRSMQKPSHQSPFSLTVDLGQVVQSAYREVRPGRREVDRK